MSDVTVVLRGPKQDPESVARRFWAKVDKTAAGNVRLCATCCKAKERRKREGQRQ